MTALRAWTLLITDEYSLPRPTGTQMHSIDPTPEGAPPAPPPRRWWSGEGTLTFEGLQWSGAQMSDGMLMDIGTIQRTQNLQESQVTARLALGDEALLRSQSRDFGPLHVEVGWIRSDDYGVSWRRLDIYHRGRLGEITTSDDGVLEARIESYMDTIDRGRVEIISASTHPDFSEMTGIASGLATDVPVFE